MSADNGYVIRENAEGKFVLQMYFASNDSYPPIDDKRALVFDHLESALEKYEEIEDADSYASEYGLTIATELIRKYLIRK